MNILDIIMKTVNDNIKNYDINKNITSFDEYKETLFQVNNIFQSCLLSVTNEISDIENNTLLTEDDMGKSFEDNSGNQWIIVDMIYCDEIDKDVFNIIEVGKSINRYCITTDGMIYLPIRNVERRDYKLKANYNHKFNYFVKWITQKID